jgi:hypothetical protein
MAKRGPRTRYNKQTDEICRNLALLGKTNIQIADVFGITEVTFYNWCRRHSTFRQALDQGGVVADGKVAHGFYERAAGFIKEDIEEIRVVSQGRGRPAKVVRLKVNKYYPPEPGAALNWLKNRQEEMWRDKQEHKVTGSLSLAEQIMEAKKERDAK